MINNLNLNLLRVFHAVSQLLSFTRAAEKLHLTQPGISRHIKELETFYETRLFDRLGKKVILTQEGEILYRATGTMFDLLRESKARIHDLHGLSGGKLVVGASITIGDYILPALLVKFREAYPDVEIKLDIALSLQVVDRILSNTVEIGFIGHYAEDRMLTVVPFKEDKMLLVVAAKHPWATRKTSVSLKELADQPFLLSREGSGTRNTVEALLDKAGIILNNTMELGTTEGVKQSVEVNLGISILSQHVVMKEIAAGTIKALRLSGVALTRNLYLVRHKDRYLSASAQAFIEIANK
jgi:DNA-binding transcriptional LysR family regulator